MRPPVCRPVKSSSPATRPAVLDTGAAIDDTTLELAAGFTGDTPPTLSANGEYIAYYDAGSNLVVNQAGTAGVLNVFRYDVATNTNQLVTSTGDGVTAGNNPINGVNGGAFAGGIGPAEATSPQISSNGQYIAYANNSDNLISGLSFPVNYDGADQVYLWLGTPATAPTAPTRFVSYDGSTIDAQLDRGHRAPR